MKNGGGHFTPELGGHFELESGAHFKLELGGQYHWNLHPLYVEKIKNLSTGAIVDKKFYLHRDYLGSIIAISDENGVAIERRHFDAWGNLAKLQQNDVAVVLPTDGTGTKLMLLDRGYTGHEHLSEVGLIHMNGRLYDPILRSFLMPDNFIQQPENTQNYNRYAYVLNNPLMYTDPSGEIGVEILGLLGSMGPTGLAIGGAIMLGSVLAAKWDDWKIKDFFNDNVSNAFKDTTKWFGKQGKSIGKFFSNMFKKSSRFNESKVTSLNYAAVNTTNTISNNFTASSTVASGGFQSNYRGNGSQSLYTFKNRQEVLDYYSDNGNFDYFGNESQFYTTYDTRFEAFASFFQIIGPEAPISIVKSISNLFSLNKAAKGGGNAFRHMSQAELEAVQSTGLLRGGRAGETFFTKDLYKSAASAQNRLALPGSPALRVEFQILNNPTLLRSGTKVLPANGMMGRGAEFMTLDPVKVRLINWQPLR